jgi:hypothetical protein
MPSFDKVVDSLPFAQRLIIHALDDYSNLTLFLVILHFVIVTLTANHCLRNCPDTKQTPYLLVILFIPICGWLLYWINNVPDSNAFSTETMIRSKKSLNLSEELLKPHTATPDEKDTSEQQAAAAAAATAKAVTEALSKPKTAKPIHIIAQERAAKKQQ